MPYIIMKRDDIPAATLQVLDLTPNTSQRNLIYDPPGQTKYINPLQNDTVVTATNGGIITMYGDKRGLAAWFLTNVNDGAGAQAANTITIAGIPADGDRVTINTASVGGPTRTFTFRTAPATQLEVLIGANPTHNAANLSNAINNPNNGLSPYVGAANVLGVITVTAVEDGVAGNGITMADTSAVIAVVSPLAGGANSAPLTTADANDDANDVLTLLAFGDLTLPAGVLTLAAINGALTAGAITAAQLRSVLDILAGRHYVVPDGTQIAAAGVFDIDPAVGAPGGPGFVTGTLRNIYNSGSLNISWGEGELLGFLDSGFIYGGIAGNPNGEAVAVYADDGTIFVPTL
jgi:hypothetical protein